MMTVYPEKNMRRYLFQSQPRLKSLKCRSSYTKTEYTFTWGLVWWVEWYCETGEVVGYNKNREAIAKLYFIDEVEAEYV